MKKDIFNFEGKVVFITGGNGYLGREISLAFCERGAEVIVNSSNKKRNLEFVQYLCNEGFNAKSCVFDVTNSKARDLALKKSSIKKINILINNAYSGPSGSIKSALDENYLNSYNHSLISTQALFKALMPSINEAVLEDQDASVINIASIYGLVSPHLKIYQKNNINPPFYGASKAALIQWTRYAAVEFADKGIRFNSVCPGPFPSPAAQTESPKLMEEIIKNVPLGRLGKSNEIVSPLLFLASSGSSYVTGSNITVDGGWTSW